MLNGMKQLVSEGCRDHFVDNDIRSKGKDLLEKEKEKREREIPLAVLREKNKLKRLERFVDMISRPDTR